jgi:hypothetical protein
MMAGLFVELLNDMVRSDGIGLPQNFQKRDRSCQLSRIGDKETVRAIPGKAQRCDKLAGFGQVVMAGKLLGLSWGFKIVAHCLSGSGW